MKRLHRTLALFSLLFVSLSSLASADENLHGKWTGASDWNQGEVLVFEAGGKAKLDGEAFGWSVPRAGHIVYSFEGLDLEMTYTIRGDALTLSLEGEQIAYKRSGPAPRPVEKPKPAPKPDAGEKENPLGKRENPLAKSKATADPFARRFEGDGLVLTLSSAAAGSYTGTLSFGGEAWPVTCRRSDDSVRGTFGEGQASFTFTAKLTGDKLSFETGDNSFQLTGEPLAASGGSAIPPAMTGVAKGATKAWKHPRGWFSMDLPKGWDVTHADDEIVSVNPGLKQGAAQNAIILMTFGGLGKTEQNTEVHTLMDSQERDFKQFFDQNQIAVTKPDGPAKKVLVGEVPGAIQTWKGTVQGSVKVDIWIGSIIKRDAFLTTIAIILDEESDKFLPGIKQTFMSLKPTPPELNPELMSATAGRTLSLNLSGEGGTFITKYEFSAGGNVHRTTMIGGITGDFDVGGETQLSGTYEIIGDELYMYFKDGQEGGQIILEGGQPSHVKMGSDTARFL
jgi:hypothetical protein